ncbi:putative Dipeptidyl-peptidase [Blattamonas nauphoetae]|uniref:Dipeptidyl-peptidase n=1 Tax=Blattamonas nauphoetae TaxID=2049346 RepID=A0ABQ9YBM5_9EUKA|nr:putative Dipeptidyl-peptidase [Blattamonas nauphoetae]
MLNEASNEKKSTSKLIFYTTSVLVVYLMHSLLGEHLIKPFKQSNAIEVSLLHPIIPTFFSIIVSIITLKYFSKTEPIPLTKNEHYLNLLCGFLMMGSKVVGTFAETKLSYPIKIIFSSSRLLLAIPAACVTHWNKKDENKPYFGYSKKELLVSFFIFVGLVVMLLPAGQDSASGLLSGFTILGAILQFISINTSCFFDEFQQILLIEGRDPTLVLLWNQNISLLFSILSILFSGRVLSCIQMLIANPGFIQSQLLVSLLSLVGQRLLIGLKAEYGIWWKNITTSSRKCISLIISIVFFGHTVTLRQSFGIVVVFVCVFVAGNVQMKQTKPKKAIIEQPPGDFFNAETYGKMKKPSNLKVAPDGSGYIYKVTEYFETSKKTEISYFYRNVDGTVEKKVFADFAVHLIDYVWADTPDTVFILDHHGSGSFIAKYNISSNSQLFSRKYSLVLDSLKSNEKGNIVCFTALVYPGTSMAETYDFDYEKETKEATVAVFEQIPVKTIDFENNNKVRHLYYMPVVVNAEGVESFAEATDIMHSLYGDCQDTHGSINPGFDISPSGEFISFVVQLKKTTQYTIRNQLFLAATTLRRSFQDPVCLSEDLVGKISSPTFDSKGEKIAFLHTKDPLEEFAAKDLIVIDILTRRKDIIKSNIGDTESIYWSRTESNFIYALSVVFAQRNLYRYDLSIKDPEPQPLILTDQSIMLVAEVAQNTFIALASSFSQPPDFYQLTISPKLIWTQITSLHTIWLDKFTYPLCQPSLLKVETPHTNDQIQCWYFAPLERTRELRTDRTYYHRLLVIAPDGPHSCFINEWNSYPAHPHFFTQLNYGVVVPHYHGCSSFGQAFKDSLKNHWHDFLFKDVICCQQQCLEAFDYLDKSKTALLGGSFGGYIANFVGSQLGLENPFQAIVTHDGIFDLDAFAFETGDTWRVQAEFGTRIWDNRAVYQTACPTYQKGAGKWATPTLFLHTANNQDIPYSQSIAGFQLYQRVGCKSRFVLIKNENRVPSKYGNIIAWMTEVTGWLDQYLTDEEVRITDERKQTISGANETTLDLEADNSFKTEL